MAPQTDFVQRIDAWLPQTQCTRCGYPRCRDYAEALANDETELNRCPPGGEATINGLAQLLDREALALDPEVGEHAPRLVASIRESECIGCTLCVKACPVDAITGSGKLMHVVIADECTGCELCLPPCPMDCIDLNRIDLTTVEQTPSGDSPWTEYGANDVATARRRIEARTLRLEAQKPEFDPTPPGPEERAAMAQYVKEAVARGRAARNNKLGKSQVVTFGGDS